MMRRPMANGITTCIQVQVYSSRDTRRREYGLDPLAAATLLVVSLLQFAAPPAVDDNNILNGIQAADKYCGRIQ